MSYCGFYTAWWELFAEIAVFAILVIFVDIGRQQMGMYVLGQYLKGFFTVP